VRFARGAALAFGVALVAAACSHKPQGPPAVPTSSIAGAANWDAFAASDVAVVVDAGNDAVRADVAKYLSAMWGAPI